MLPNIYHRHLKLPFEYPKPEEFNHAAETFAVYWDRHKIYQPFKTWIESHSVTISNVLEAFYTEPMREIPPHSDTADLPGAGDTCKLNFTWGPKNSTTRWWKIKDESKLIKRYFGDDRHNTVFDSEGIVPDINIVYSLVAEHQDIDLAYEAVIDHPCLFNNSQLHSTWNPSPTEHRWTLCFNLLEQEKALLFDRALEIFKKYIVEPK